MHAVTGKLNQAANQFQAGDSVGFGIRLGVKYRDPKTKQDDWTNYNAAIFAKSPGQIAFYQQALVEGAIVTVTAEQLKIDSFESQTGTKLTIDMLNARIGYVYNPNQQPAQQSAQQGYQQPQQIQQPQQGYMQPNGQPMNPQQVQQMQQQPMQNGMNPNDPPF